MSFMFENLDVYKKAVSFAEEIGQADIFKGKVCDFLKGKLELQSLAGNFTRHQPNYFSVWEFNPKQK